VADRPSSRTREQPDPCLGNASTHRSRVLCGVPERPVRRNAPLICGQSAQNSSYACGFILDLEHSDLAQAAFIARPDSLRVGRSPITDPAFRGTPCRARK
jgi:hypothetical protein